MSSCSNAAAPSSKAADTANPLQKLAIDRARADGAASVGTEHLLHGVLAEGNNLALHVFRAAEVDPGQVERALVKVSPAPAEHPNNPPAAQFSGAAANALELTVTEAIALGHNYVGCEHLLLGLISEPDGTAGHCLRELAMDLRSTRRAVMAALSGYAHLRAQTGNNTPMDAATVIATTVRQELRPILSRIERLERQTGLDAEG
jgi:ATP-dependent Clp protease ATP-binding subunit ClpA